MQRNFSVNVMTFDNGLKNVVTPTNDYFSPPILELITRISSLGNRAYLHQLLKKISDHDSVVISFGDHIISDINASKRRTNWLAAVIVEEFEFDSPPIVTHTTAHHPNTTVAESSYRIGNISESFASFFIVPTYSIILDEAEQNEADLMLSSLSSY